LVTTIRSKSLSGAWRPAARLPNSQISQGSSAVTSRFMTSCRALSSDSKGPRLTPANGATVDADWGTAASSRISTFRTHDNPSPHSRRGEAPVAACSMRERVGPHLEVHGHRLHALAAFLQPRHPIAARCPQAAALPTGIRIVDPAVEALGVEAGR